MFCFCRHAFKDNHLTPAMDVMMFVCENNLLFTVFKVEKYSRVV